MSKCPYGDAHDGAPHTCPFKEDAQSDDGTLCQCCPACTRDCMEDI